MSRRAQRLAERRQALVERSAAQRAAVARCAEPWMRRAAALDRVITFARSGRLVGLAARAATLYLLLRR